jgi:hypothetical protein
MAPTPTVGLVGSRIVDDGLQSSDKKTVTDFAFPKDSRTPLQISIPREGAVNYSGPKLGDCYKDGAEDTNMCVRAHRDGAKKNPLGRHLGRHCPLPSFPLILILPFIFLSLFSRRLKMAALALVTLYGTYMLQYVA